MTDTTRPGEAENGAVRPLERPASTPTAHAAPEALNGRQAGAELTAEEARALVDELGLDLYRAQDALAFVGECCDIADREQQLITTAHVREWLKGARCGRQIAAENAPSARQSGAQPDTGPEDAEAPTGPHTGAQGAAPRMTANTATDDGLDALYAELDAHKARLDAARRELNRLALDSGWGRDTAARIRAALDGGEGQ